MTKREIKPEINTTPGPDQQTTPNTRRAAKMPIAKPTSPNITSNTTIETSIQQETATVYTTKTERLQNQIKFFIEKQKHTIILRFSRFDLISTR